MKIEMTGYNDGKAIAIYSNIKIFPYFAVTLILSLVSMILALVFNLYELMWVFLLPILLLLGMLLNTVVNSHAKGYLKGLKVKHRFCLENGILFKDGKEIKSTEDIKIYKFRKFLFLELKQSYYRIEDSDYITGSRTEFLAQVKFYNKRRVYFDLPEISDEKITDLLFGEIDTKNKLRLFCSSDKKRIVYIYRNANGTYSVGREKMTISDNEERIYTHKYGWWEPEPGDNSISFYGTEEEAFNDIRNELKGFTELTGRNQK